MNAADTFGPRCPVCDISVELPTDGSTKLPAHAPFCSERCRLLDLGRWLNEEHALPCEGGEDEQSDENELGSANSAAARKVKLPPGWHDA